MPWLKRIALTTGDRVDFPLSAEAPFSLGRVAPLPDDEGDDFVGVAPPVAAASEELVKHDGASWFHVGTRGTQWLLHGSTMRAADAVFVFMEHPEARHPELEAALPRDASAADVYADWLLEQGDPFGAALKPQVAKERGPAGLWWLEGFERSGALTVSLRDGFVREATLALPQRAELESTLHRLCHLRAFVALERLTIALRAYDDEWSEFFQHPVWMRCHWPRALRQLAFTPAPPGALLAAFAQRLRVASPQLTVAT